MIRDFENMGREEFLQFITLCFSFFYNSFDYFTENEKKYLKEFVDKLDEVYHI